MTAVFAPPAGASAQPGLVVTPAAPVAEHDYPGIPLPYPGTVAVLPDPSDCGGSSQFLVFIVTCDQIPLKVVPIKGLGPTDDLLVRIDVSWVDPSATTDLDIYVFDNQQISKRADPESVTYTQLAEGTSAENNPETARVFNPTLGDYNIVVLNSTGVFPAYHLKVTMQVTKGDKLFELLEEVIGPAAAASEAPPVDLSAASPVVVPSGLDDSIAAAPDLQLDQDFGPSTLTQELAAPPPALNTLNNKPAAPTSGLAIVLWLVIVPLALLGASLAFVVRRGMLRSNV
jgi:hypothetical protein